MLVLADKAGNNDAYKEVLTTELNTSDRAYTYVGKDECVD